MDQSNSPPSALSRHVLKQVCVFAVFFAAGTWQVDAMAWAEGPVQVRKTHNDSPFEYQPVLLRTERAMTVYQLTYPSPITTSHEPDNTVTAEYYLPNGISNGEQRPAVICLHILNGNYELVRILCSSLAARGVPAIMFKLPYYGERALPGGFRDLEKNPALFVGLIPQAVADVRRTVDLLASRPEVDPDRIGIAGISLGGLIAARAAAEEPRLSRAAFILAGGDLPEIISTAHETRGLSSFIKSLPKAERASIETAIKDADPLTHARKLHKRGTSGNILMINAASDEVIPPQCTKKLASEIGMAERVHWLDGLGHYTAIAELPSILRQTVSFFGGDLPPPQNANPPVSNLSARDRVVQLLDSVVKFVATMPESGRCHLIDVQADVSRDGKTIVAGRVLFARGTDRRFRLTAQIDQPEEIAVALGRDKSPWLASINRGVVFYGKKETLASPESTIWHLDEKQQLKLRMALGVLSAAVVSPTLLDQVLTLGLVSSEGDKPTVELKLKRPAEERLVLQFCSDGTRPLMLSGEIDGTQIELRFHAWQLNSPAPNALFSPAGNLRTILVEHADVERIMSAVIGFLLEKVE